MEDPNSMQMTQPQGQQGYGQQGQPGPPGYGQQQPGYGQPPPPGGTNTTIIMQAPPAKPSNYMALAIVTTICCNLVFGIIAIVFSVMSSSAADDGDMDSAKTRGKISMAMSIIGILSTIIIIIIIIVYFVVIVAAATSTVATYGQYTGK